MPSTQTVTSYKPSIRPQPKVTAQANRLSSNPLDNIMVFAYTAPDRARTLVCHCRTLVFASKSAPLTISSLTTAVLPLLHAQWRRVQLSYTKATSSASILLQYSILLGVLEGQQAHPALHQPYKQPSTSTQGYNSIKATHQALMQSTGRHDDLCIHCPRH